MRQGRLSDLLSAVPPYTPPRGLQTGIFRKTFYTQSTAQTHVFRKTFYTQSSEQTAQDAHTAQNAQNAHNLTRHTHTAQNFTIALG